MVTIGMLFTKTFKVSEAEQPPVDVPTTVYVMLATGETFIVEPVKLPGIHEYVLAPEADKVDD